MRDVIDGRGGWEGRGGVVRFLNRNETSDFEQGKGRAERTRGMVRYQNGMKHLLQVRR